MKKSLSRKSIWENTPASLKLLFGGALRVIPKRMLLGSHFVKENELIQSSQNWDKDTINKFQFEKLRELCLHANNHSPFYRNIFREFDFHPEEMVGLSCFKRLPLIDKKIINNHRDEILTVDPSAASVDYVTTGGTSGEPLNFFIESNRSPKEFAYLLSSWERIGYKPNKPLAVLRGKVINNVKRGMRHEYDPLMQYHHYSTFYLNKDTVAKYIDHIKGIGDCFLHVYPSSIFTLSKIMKSENISPPSNIKGILAESEIIYPDQRQFVENIFGVRYFSSYGHTEKLVAAAECEHSSDYHVWPTYGYFELLDEDGNDVTEPGKEGEIVGTGFMNHAMPFIRYKTGDRAVYVGDHCDKCGRNHMLIRDIEGHRTQEYLVSDSGSLISWTALNMHDDTFDGVKQFQFLQEEPGLATLKIVPISKLSRDAEKRIMSRLNSKIGNQININIITTDKIDLTKRGKTVYVDQRIDMG